MSDQCFETAEAVAAYAAERLAELCRQAVEARGVCHLVLAGGTTPRRCYELLREMQLPWQSMHIWFGDERCLPIGESERNDVMADEALLKHVSVPSGQIHRIAAELGAESAAESYEQLLTAAPAMDIVLLGMGEDGHTASLFPENIALQDKRLALPVYNSPKPPAERVDRKSTRLNSSHITISYAVFCLKKKKKIQKKKINKTQLTNKK